METTGLDFTMEQPPSSRRLAAVHRTAAFRWVRVLLPAPNKHRNFDTKITVLIFVYIRKNQVISIFLCEIQNRCGVEPQRSFLFIGLSPFCGYKSCERWAIVCETFFHKILRCLFKGSYNPSSTCNIEERSV